MTPTPPTRESRTVPRNEILGRLATDALFDAAPDAWIIADATGCRPGVTDGLGEHAGNSRDLRDVGEPDRPQSVEKECEERRRAVARTDEVTEMHGVSP